MPRTSHRAKLVLTTEQSEELAQLARSRTAPQREVQRARMLSAYHEGHTFTQIATLAQTTRRLAYECIDRALAMGIHAALRDLPHGKQEHTILPEDKAWVVHLACTQPKELGYAAELWTRRTLAQHIRRVAVSSAHPGLARAGKATVQRILDEQELKPHKIRYYLQRRDPDFEAKMNQVLVVYRELSMEAAQGVRTPEGQQVFTVSVDEKPGVQAIANTAPDLPPVPGQHPSVGRDYEYKRLGTASILAGLDLEDGHVTARVERRHRSREFIALLKDLDTHYPTEAVIRLILDNHSAHISRETRAYLATRPNRFCYVHTPTHGSWLNLVETLFGKMARTFLRGMRVASWEELRERVLKGIEEINLAPVVHRWRKFESLKMPL